MCGIVGLHLRNPELHPRLGELLTGMLCEMSDRGSDSAGVAVYGDPTWTPAGHGCVSLLEIGASPESVSDAVGSALGVAVSVTVLDATYLVTAQAESEAVLAAARAAFPEALVAGFGDDLAVLKGVGDPRRLADSWGLATAQGWQGVGHTRMATESAVTPSGAHPYAVGPDQCLVHNGSFANHATIRRELRAAGVEFDSENDTEVGARFVATQLAAGRDVETALKELCATFDGFYTLLVSNRDSFAVVRDAIACKPAVIAETSDWVAMASEYRALSSLPGVENAAIWEPEPEVVYAWKR
ncbi:class II glutamine amidotransferase domain-containing protein [Mycolicibacterium litorale]|uniref:glutamine--fructose-6-phosphate transaminase (isomerizing) n=1 Tax=Mycolicibacterium litorale TaxID=758802 RepID=A0AAD1IQ85_9MYCO|nr:glutamine amidotransferase [Mycolicibacterium litorale]MCV7417866.1 glutamine amidotransferase [Mycolicibacterium litorale]TDY06745.1 N-methylglutamate synthase subunit A [Mycolicibacterium litorale]BBY19101.1 glutamine amidotransferase [Mycolicibacterium litorale]